MAQIDKLKERIKTIPSDFSWNELRKLLNNAGYIEIQSGKTSGSRVRFIHNDHEPISLHKPHPSPIMKKYAVRDIVKTLKNRGQL